MKNPELRIADCELQIVEYPNAGYGFRLPPSAFHVSLKLHDRRGHALAYVGLFLFTAVLYFRPHQFFPALLPFSIPLVLALFTLVAFLSSQIMLEGRLTARPREVNLVLLLCLTAVLSIPLAIHPGGAWSTFNDAFIKVVLMFLVIVNVVRTERRLKGLLFLAVAAGCVLSVSTLNNFLTGNFMADGFRAQGAISGAFADVNDMSLYLVTMIPITIALLLSTRGLLWKLLYAACAVLMVAAITVTFSRGGFLGLIAAILVLAWQLGRHNRLAVSVVTFIGIAVFFALAPGQYGGRLESILNPSIDPSANARRALLYRSTEVALEHPLLGVGMGNFHHLSIRGKSSHNSYTQVAADMGLPALVIYLLFIIVPLRRLRQIESETFAIPQYSRIHYLAVGLQASLAGYMVGSFFLSVAYYFYIYYLVGYTICLRRIYETGPGRVLGRATLESAMVEEDSRE